MKNLKLMFNIFDFIIILITEIICSLMIEVEKLRIFITN